MPTNQTAQVNIRLTDEEREFLEKASDKSFLPLSTWMRAICLKEAERVLNEKKESQQ